MGFHKEKENIFDMNEKSKLLFELCKKEDLAFEDNVKYLTMLNEDGKLTYDPTFAAYIHFDIEYSDFSGYALGSLAFKTLLNTVIKHYDELNPYDNVYEKEWAIEWLNSIVFEPSVDQGWFMTIYDVDLKKVCWKSLPDRLFDTAVKLKDGKYW